MKKVDNKSISAQFGEMKDWMGEEFGKINIKLDEHGVLLTGLREDVDSIKAELIGVHQEIGGLRDDLSAFKDEVRTDVGEIREHINLPKTA